SHLINQFHLNTKTLHPKKPYITYINQAQKITQFLSLLAPHNSLLPFQHLPILRHITNSLNPLLNSQTPNFNKTIPPSLPHLQNIQFIHQ
ncbi:DNA-binding protein WhiA, partial [Bacillus sp. WP8]|uniref:DNA-binding protein WhiA n=1 Tax=Bacillus sp. WP8 TaxID=756828 RepID=UPI0011A91AD0